MTTSNKKELPIITDIKKIISNTNIDNDEKLKEIENLEKKDINNLFKNNFEEIKNLIKTNINNPNLIDELDKINDDMLENLDNIGAAIYEETIKNSVIDELMEEDPSAEIGEVEKEINDIYMQENFDLDFEVPQNNVEKIKKIYKWKVDGQIKSGIEDLDKFLAIIQPAINQIFIAPWRVIYGINDARQWAIENFTNNQNKQKDLSSAWKTGKYLNILNGDFSYIKSNKKNQKEIMEKYHSYWLQELNDKNLKNIYSQKIIEEIKNENPNISNEELTTRLKQKLTQELDTWKKSEEAQKYIRTKVFDENEDPSLAQEVLIEGLLSLYANLRKDGKISDEDSKILKGYCAAIDLFNTKNSQDFYQTFAQPLTRILQSDKEKYKKGNVENIDAQQWLGRTQELNEKSDLLEKIKSLVKENENVK